MIKELFASIVVFVTTVTSLPGAEKVYVGQACTDQNRPGLSDVNHASFDTLLQKYVNEQGLVAYEKWKADKKDLKALENYLIELGCVDLKKTASTKAKLAYWINAYNSVTLWGILREYPTTSIRKHTGNTYNIWKDLLFVTDGQAISLDAMEHQVLRKMNEPRIHFAIVCASIGCPPLRNHAYTADKLDDQLDATAKLFFGQARNFKLDPTSRTVYLSQIFEWFGKDFAPTSADQLALLKKYFPANLEASWVTGRQVQVKYLNYDWSLNDQKMNK